MDKRTERKNKIIEDSISLMYLNGYNGTSVKDITDAAGIPKGSFYNYFDGKEQYAIDAVKYYTDIGHDDFLILKKEELKSIDRIKAFYRAKIKKLKGRGTKYGCLVGNLSEEVGGVHPLIAKETADFHKNVEQLIYDNLVEGRNKKEFTNTIDDRILAGFIVSAWQGSLLRVKTSDDFKYVDDFYTVLENDLLR